MRISKKMQSLVANGKSTDAAVQYRLDNPEVSLQEAVKAMNREKEWLLTALLTDIRTGRYFGVD